MGRILNLKPWSDQPVTCDAPRPLRSGVVEAIATLLDGKPSPAEVADAAAEVTGTMQERAILGSQPRYGFVLKNARPIKPVGTVTRPYGRFPAAAFPLSDIADPWLDNRRAQVTHKKRFSEADRNDHDQVIGVYVPYAARLHPDLFRKHMVKDRKARDQ
jgi:hypothetical protein